MQSPDMERSHTPTSLDFDTVEPFTRQLYSLLSSSCNMEQTNMEYGSPVSLLN
ncbi:hypothetical protein DPMN_007532 [Dreissena polymorpha]|uniref:Uncharacterized protein n=1 Tax=Dreissena polymorpha TaxID=45954 RepID=A0A9D4RUL4_DREPO|nr:hypothetical protein DPMN_006144 [Dreissena polymorpha]KAH3883572.1 hypothetical protein DPMN_007532 [Dreissena polymorpha]